MAIFVALLFTMLTLIYALYRRTFYFWKNLGVPQFDFTFPHGNAKFVFKDIHIGQFQINYYRKVKEIGSKFGGVYMFIRPSLLIVDLELIKTILVKDFNIFPDRAVYYNEKDDPISAHLANLDGIAWRNLRQKLSGTFTNAKIKFMFGTIADVADKLLTVIDKQISEMVQLEVKETFARFTTDIIGSAAFGIDCNSLEDANSQFYTMGAKVMTGPKRPPFYVKVLKNVFRNLARKLHIKALPEDISEFYMTITKETVDYREKNPNFVRRDFMNNLVELKRSNVLTLEQVAAQSFVFYVGGFETSSGTMTHCLYELSMNQTIQEKARQSVRSALDKHGSFTYEAVADMEYLKMCVEETLRKYPAIPGLQRSSIKDYKIPDSNVVIPKGQLISIPVYAIHWDETIYPEPERFNPDRFTAEEKEKRHPYAYIPFGEGPRTCFGMRFALIATKLTLAKLLLNYKFSVNRSKTSIPIKINPKSFVMSMSKGIYLNIEKIRN